MKNARLLFFLILLIIMFPGTPIYAFQCDTDAMSAELDAAYTADQEIRHEMMGVLSKYQETGEGMTDLLRLKGEMDSIDQSNQELLTQWMNRCGWPDGLTSNAHRAVFMILQHGGLEEMKRFIGEVREKVDKGLMKPESFALMSDRIAMREGRHQTYGTQTFQSPNSVNTVWPVKNPERLDQRRQQVGLPPMQEYIRVAKDSMGVVMVMDSTLTLEAAREMRGMD
jgi:hypothetical protein